MTVQESYTQIEQDRAAILREMAEHILGHIRNLHPAASYYEELRYMIQDYFNLSTEELARIKDGQSQD